MSFSVIEIYPGSTDATQLGWWSKISTGCSTNYFHGAKYSCWALDFNGPDAGNCDADAGDDVDARIKYLPGSGNVTVEARKAQRLTTGSVYDTVQVRVSKGGVSRVGEFLHIVPKATLGTTYSTLATLTGSSSTIHTYNIGEVADPSDIQDTIGCAHLHQDAETSWAKNTAWGNGFQSSNTWVFQYTF